MQGSNGCIEIVIEEVCFFLPQIVEHKKTTLSPHVSSCDSRSVLFAGTDTFARSNLVNWKNLPANNMAVSFNCLGNFTSERFIGSRFIGARFEVGVYL